LVLLVWWARERGAASLGLVGESPPAVEDPENLDGALEIRPARCRAPAAAVSSPLGLGFHPARRVGAPQLNGDQGFPGCGSAPALAMRPERDAAAPEFVGPVQDGGSAAKTKAGLVTAHTRWRLAGCACRRPSGGGNSCADSMPATR